MKRFSQQFNKKAKDISLSAVENRELRNRVISYMEYHPLPSALKAGAVIVSGQKEHFILFNFNKWRVLRWSGSLALLLVVSISYIAEKAIPGDVLYAIKVGFNEELRSTVTLGSYEKVVWETERLNRRIAEARLLADEGRLTQEVEAEVVSAIKLHSDNARREIKRLKLSDKDEATLASLSLTTALDLQSVSLNRRDNNKVEGEAQSTALIQAMLTQTQNAELIAQDNELPAYNRLIAKVESETTRAHELLKGVTTYASTVEQGDIKKRLDDIDKKIITAMASVESDELAAKQGLVNALQQTHRLIVFMTNIGVRDNLTIEELVPNSLSIEDRFLALRLRVQQTEDLIEISETALSTSTATSVNESVKDKVLPAIASSKAAIASLKESLLNNDESQLEAMEALVLDSYSIIFDVATLLELKVGHISTVLENDIDGKEEVSVDLDIATTTEEDLEV